MISSAFSLLTPSSLTAQPIFILLLRPRFFRGREAIRPWLYEWPPLSMRRDLEERRPLDPVGVKSMACGVAGLTGWARPYGSRFCWLCERHASISVSWMAMFAGRFSS